MCQSPLSIRIGVISQTHTYFRHVNTYFRHESVSLALSSLSFDYLSIVNTIHIVVIIKLRETSVKQNLINDNFTPVSRNKITFKVKPFCIAENELLRRGIV